MRTPQVVESLQQRALATRNLALAEAAGHDLVSPCAACFADSTQPQWLGRTTDLTDTLVFHIVRILHVAGGCVDCGACDRACPLGVDLRKLTKKVENEVRHRHVRPVQYRQQVRLQERSGLRPGRAETAAP